MAHQTLNLDIPDDLYHELKKRAEAAQVPVGDELLNLAVAMLALNSASEPVNEFFRHIEGLSRTLSRNTLFHTILTVTSIPDLTHALEELGEGIPRPLVDQQLLETLARRGPAGEKRHALDILAELPGHQSFQTAEEVDRYVREERESWEG